jgi:hypothetical protein
MFEIIGQSYEPPRFETFDEGTAMQEMRAACGDRMEEVIADLQGWVAKRPAVAALLDDGVLLGNHPGTLLTLGAIAQAAKAGLDITKPQDAAVYVERVMNDPKSDYWTNGPLHKLAVQGMQFAMAVADSKKR